MIGNGNIFDVSSYQFRILRVDIIEAQWRIYASVNYAIIGSDNGLSPGRRQAIIWTNDVILLIGHLGTNFNDFFFIKIKTFSLTNLYLKVSSAKVVAILTWPQCVNGSAWDLMWLETGSVTCCINNELASNSLHPHCDYTSKGRICVSGIKHTSTFNLLCNIIMNQSYLRTTKPWAGQYHGCWCPGSLCH